jgi:hypothetical protein
MAVVSNPPEINALRTFEVLAAIPVAARPSTRMHCRPRPAMGKESSISPNPRHGDRGGSRTRNPDRRARRCFYTNETGRLASGVGRWKGGVRIPCRDPGCERDSSSVRGVVLRMMHSDRLGDEGVGDAELFGDSAGGEAVLGE